MPRIQKSSCIHHETSKDHVDNLSLFIVNMVDCLRSNNFKSDGTLYSISKQPVSDLQAIIEWSLLELVLPDQQITS